MSVSVSESVYCIIISTDVSKSMNIYTIVESIGGLREALHSCLIAEEVFHHIIILDG